MTQAVPTTPSLPEPTEERLEVQKIRAAFPDAILDVNTFRGDTRILVQRDSIVAICQLLRDDPDLEYNFFLECLGVDYLDSKDDYRYEVVYNLYSMPYVRDGVKHGKNRRIFLKI